MKYKVLKSFGGAYYVKGVRITISAGMNDIIDLPATGHDFEKAGLVERVTPKKKAAKKAK
jgi:hypothetical protein